MTSRLTVLYGRDADAYLVARDADRALEGSGCHVSVKEACDEETGAPTGEHEVWLRSHGEPATKATQFLPGQLPIVTHDDGWRIENGPGSEAAA